jgi:hypothetical protein
MTGPGKSSRPTAGAARGARGGQASSRARPEHTWRGPAARTTRSIASRRGSAPGYACYDHFTDISHQLCAAHLLRDLEDAAEIYPDAIWPGQTADALRALIHQVNLARAQGLDAVPDDRIAKERKLFRHGVRVGLSEIPRNPGSFQQFHNATRNHANAPT